MQSPVNAFLSAPRFSRSVFFSTLLSLLVIIGLSPKASLAQTAGQLLVNGGFEGGSGSDGAGAGVPRWNAFEQGYAVDRTVFHGGEQSIRCDAIRDSVQHGATITLSLNQKRSAPIVISGWSKSDSVNGAKGPDYAVYIDIEHTDGTPLWGQFASFRTGTHGWERRQVLISPTKPISKITIIGLFRKHTGTVWFDDFSANQVDGAGIFDGQPLLPLPNRPFDTTHTTQVLGGDGLSLSLDDAGSIVGVRTDGQSIKSPTVGGFWVRDVAANQPPAPMRGKLTPRPGNGEAVEASSDSLRIRFVGRLAPEKDSISVDGDLTDMSNTDRAMTVYFAIPLAATNWKWSTDIHRSVPIRPDTEYSNLTAVNVGATSACLSTQSAAFMGRIMESQSPTRWRCRRSIVSFTTVPRTNW